MLVMLVDTRRPDDDGHGSAREPWLVTLLGFALPWPALIIWLCAVSRVVDGWPSVIAAYLAVALTAWRGLRSLPSDGLNQSRQ
jgi:hypothetical protein